MKYLYNYLNVFNISSFLLKKWKRSSIFLILFQFYFYYNFISVILKILYIKYTHIYPSPHTHVYNYFYVLNSLLQNFSQVWKYFELINANIFLLSSLNILFMENVLKQNIIVCFLKCIFLVFLDKGIHKKILQKCRVSRSAIIYTNYGTFHNDLWLILQKICIRSLHFSHI